MTKSNLSRREFLKRMAQLSAAGAATPFAINLAAISDAAAFDGTGDYKALVCVFLSGGNDHGNTLVPFDDANYDMYRSIRQELALAKDSLLELTPTVGLPSGMQMAFHENMTRLQGHFNQGNLAIMQNVGNLVVPTTLTEYKERSVPLPPKLFSHNDQQAYWQAAAAEGARLGWGGKIGDLAMSSNGGGSLFTCINAGGSAVFLSGRDVVKYSISSSGAVSIRPARPDARLYGSEAIAAALREVITEPRTHALEHELNTVTNRSIEAEKIVSVALESAGELSTAFADDRLSRQLNLVARLIKARDMLQVNRQVFMVQLGGFDNHDNLLTNHADRLGELSDALSSFYEATEELGVANNVTTFTGSDFGRTMGSNGDGSDHGWGGHQFIIGGAVQGGQFYGTTPEVALESENDVGKGRLLPSTSVDAYAATLAKWFGVSDTELEFVTPNITNFTTRDLGFLV